MNDKRISQSFLTSQSLLKESHFYELEKFLTQKK